MKKKILMVTLGGALILGVGLYFGRSSASSLHEAAKRGSAELIIKLAQDGLDVNQVNLEGQTPLMLAAQADENALGVTELLLAQGARVNEVDQYGNTALIYAAQTGDLSVVKALVEHNADASIENKSGAKAIDFAEGDEHFFVTQYLEGLGK
jgi:ankyrin repeat protein